MKRKLIQTLLTTGQLSDEVLKLLPGDAPDADTARAREVLTAAIKRFKNAGTATPEAVYGVLCGSMAAQLAEFLKGTAPAKASKPELARVQALLTPLLTSKAGRPKTNDLSRQEQNAIAQASRRDRLKKEGRKQINVWIRPEAAAYLEAIKTIHSSDSQADALELVLEAAMKGEVLHKHT